MTFSVPSSVLRTILSRVKPCVSTKTTLPILGHVRLHMEDGSNLCASATDLDRWASAYCVLLDPPETPVALCLPFGKLYAASQGFGEALATFAIKDGACLIEAGRSRIKLPVMDASEYKDWRQKGTHLHTDPKLHEKLARLLPFVLTGDAEQKCDALRNILIRDGMAVACSRHTLLEEPLVNMEGVDCLIPAETARMAADMGAGVASIMADSIQFLTEEHHLLSKLSVGNFPDYRKALPKGDLTISTNRLELIEAIQHCLTVCESKTYDAIDFSACEDGLNVSLVTAGGEAVRTVEASGLPSASFSASGQYMLRCLRAFSDDQIAIYFTDSLSPLRFQQEGRMALCWTMRTK